MDEEPGAKGSPSAGPLAAEDVVRLDLREAPTRQEAGFRPGDQDLVLSRVGDAIDVELELPEGTVRLDAFRVNLRGGPDGQPEPSYAERVLVSVRTGDTESVRDQLSRNAAPLQLDPAEVQDWAAGAPTPDRSGNQLFRSAAVEPLIEVEVRSGPEQTWTINYSFSFDQPPAGSVGTPS